MKNFLALTFLSLFFLTQCNRDYYLTSGYDAYAPTHETVAVLPSKTVTNGRIPAEWTEAMILEIEENESQALQIALFDEISERSGIRSGEVRVHLQHYSETNALLAEAGISIRESWNRSPTELAEMLGVDAIVRTTVQKEIYLTELESFGLDLASSMIAIFNGPFWVVPNSKTSDVLLSAAVIDGGSSVVIWNTEKIRSTDWNRPHSEIVRGLARVMARRFPYRENT